jgi:predicted RNase H-like HicB family nuclease
MKNSSTDQNTKRKRNADVSGVIAADQALAASYTLVLEPLTNGSYRGRSLELPTVLGFGADVSKCAKDVQESLALAIAAMREAGQAPPPPATEGKRDDQVNIKLTRHERAFINEAARREGFRSVSDFMRSVAVRQLR